MKNIKTKLFVCVFILIMAIGTPISINAWQTGGQGGAGGSTGTGASVLTDGGDRFDSGTYLFQFVYKPQSSQRYQLACAVVYSGLTKGKVGNVQEKAKIVANANGCKYINNSNGGKIYQLARELAQGRNLDDIPVIKKQEANEYLKPFGKSVNDITQPQIQPGTYNSYGYRILIQKLTCFGVTNDWCKVLYPRKDFANDYGDNLLFGSSWQNDLYTTHDDMGITASKHQGQNPWYTSRGLCKKENDNLCRLPLGKNFADKNKGEGFNIIAFDPEISKDRDYSIDIVCENCDSKDTNGSLIIKDTSDFNAILNSASLNNRSLASNVENYFNKGNGIYCREGYKIILPNANDQITVASGRYFTINKQGGKTYDVGVPNYKTIKVTKTRECRATLTKSELQSGMSASAQQNAQAVKLNNFRNNNKISKPNGNDYTGKAGTISLTYKETMKNSKYNTTVELEENKARTIPKDSRSNSNETYQVDGVSGTFTSYYVDKYTSEQYYELSNEAAKAVYRYVHRGTNTAVKGTPTDIKFYLDMETSNFPVSYNNNGDSEGIAATMKFNYKLPTNDKNSKMYTAFDANGKYNNKLTDKESDADNSYKKYLSGDRSAEVMNEINNSACAEKYGIGTGAFTTCAKGKTSGKTGDCYYKFNGTGYYTCDIKSGKCKDGEAPCPDGSCPVNGKCPNTSERSCKLYLGIYYGPNGEVIEPQTEEEFNKRCPNNKICRIENGKYYGQNGTEVTQEQYYSECPYRRCTIINGKYYGKNGQLVTQEIYQKECPYDCPFDCKYGCCPTWYEGSGMMCKDMNGECPLGGNRIIYRPIDLFNPFPGQTNYGRATGANWCSWNTKTGKITCNNGNPIVQREILNNRKSDNDKVYDKKPLYTFELDASSIQKIRNYNKKQRRNGEDYDDFTLNCTNPNKCFSTFFRDKGIIKMDTNNSACARTSELDKCAESEEGGR